VSVKICGFCFVLSFFHNNEKGEITYTRQGKVDHETLNFTTNKELQDMEGNERVLSLEKEILNLGNGSQSSAAVENCLEALKVLSNAILHELEAVKQAKKNDLSGKIDLATEVQRYEEDLIRCALLRTGGNQLQAARLLSVKVTTFRMKIKRYGISPIGLFQEKEIER
jgi:transcriptional regulator with GAF, ATPase, and Fis domain